MADIQKATQLANMQIPEGWAAYQAQQSVEQDQFFQSGVIQAVPSIASAFTGGGKLVNIPMFKPLEDVAPQTIDDTKDITLNTIGTQLAQARLYGLLQAWSATDLSGELSGTDPLGNIGTSVQTYWRHINEKILLGTMDGVYASDSMKDKNQFNAADNRRSDNTFSLKNFNEARFQLGDRYRDLATVVVHSNILKELQNANITDPKTGNTILINGNQLPTQISAPNPGDSIKGVRVIVDDTMPVKDGVYTSYLFASGAFGWSELPTPRAAETGRDALRFQGVDYLISRRRFVLAPQGMSWNESAFAADNPNKPFPGMEDLANGKYWNRVFDPKIMPYVKFTTTDEAIKQATTSTLTPGK